MLFRGGVLCLQIQHEPCTRMKGVKCRQELRLVHNFMELRRLPLKIITDVCVPGVSLLLMETPQSNHDLARNQVRANPGLSYP